MARSQSEAEFDNLVAQDQATFLASRGAKSQFSEIELPVGEYYAKLIDASRDVFDMDIKDEQKNSTGQKARVRRIKIRLVIIASADPRCTTPQEMMAYSGKQEYITLIMPPGDQEASDRAMATLGSIGIPTEQFVVSERDITDPNTQLTLAQGLAMIAAEQPLGKVAVTESKGRKYLNFRSRVRQDEVEALIGQPIDGGNFASPQEAQDVNPQDTNPPMTWSDEYQLWNIDGTDEWCDQEGNPVPSPVPPPAPAAPPVRRPPAAPAARAAAPAARTTSAPAANPGGRRLPSPTRR